MRGRRSLVLQLVVTAGFLTGLLLQVNLGDLAGALRGVDVWWLLPAAVTNLASDYVRAIRWRYLLLPAGDFPTRRVFGLILVSLVTNILLPLRAGDVFRLQYLGARGIDRLTILGTMAGERVLDSVIFASILLAAFSVELAAPLGPLRASAAAVAGVGLVVVLIVARLGGRRVEQIALPRGVPESLTRKAVGGLVALARGLVTLRQPRLLVVAFATSAGSWLLEGLTYYFTGRAMGLELVFLDYLVVLTVANIVVAIPLTPAGIGPWEFFTSYMLRASGASGVVSAAYAILAHAMVAGPLVVAGILAVWFMGLRPRDVFYLKQPERASSPDSEAAADRSYLRDRQVG